MGARETKEMGKFTRFVENGRVVLQLRPGCRQARRRCGRCRLPAVSDCGSIHRRGSPDDWLQASLPDRHQGRHWSWCQGQVCLRRMDRCRFRGFHRHGEPQEGHEGYPQGPQEVSQKLLTVTVDKESPPPQKKKPPRKKKKKKKKKKS